MPRPLVCPRGGQETQVGQAREAQGSACAPLPVLGRGYQPCQGGVEAAAGFFRARMGPPYLVPELWLSKALELSGETGKVLVFVCWVSGPHPAVLRPGSVLSNHSCWGLGDHLGCRGSNLALLRARYSPHYSLSDCSSPECRILQTNA